MLTHFFEEEAMKKAIELNFIQRMPCQWFILSLIVIPIILGICPCNISAQTFDQNSATLTNDYLPMKFGDKLTYKTYGFPLINYEYIEAIERKTIDQVECLKVKDSFSYSSTTVYYYWLAQDTFGNVWILQYNDVELNEIQYFGRSNAKLAMPSVVNVGSTLWDGTETVVATGVAVSKLSTGLGPYSNCIKSKIDYGDGDIDYYYYAPDFGQVKMEFNDDGGINGFEISSIKTRSKAMPWLPLLLDD
jgi:hypothetical protein